MDIGMPGGLPTLIHTNYVFSNAQKMHDDGF